MPDKTIVVTLRLRPWWKRLFIWPSVYLKHYKIIREFNGRWESLWAAFLTSNLMLYPTPFKEKKAGKE